MRIAGRRAGARRGVALRIGATDTPAGPVDDTPYVPPGGGVVTLFSDDFSTGNFTHTENGISWGGSTSVDITTAIKYSGTHAVRFNMAGNRNQSQLQFGGLADLDEVYVQYRLYLPSGTESPSVGTQYVTAGTGNDKIFRLWGDTYTSGPGGGSSKVGFSVRGTGTAGDCRLFREYRYMPMGAEAGAGTMWSMGEGKDPPGPHSLQNFLSTRRGQWLKIGIHAKVCGPDNASGVLEFYIDDVLVLGDTTLHNLPDALDANYYTDGYIFGWAANAYPVGQYAYLDDFTISTGGFP